MSIATGWKLDIVLTFSKQKSNQNVVTFSTRGVEPFSTSFRLLLFRISAVNCRPENSPKKKNGRRLQTTAKNSTAPQTGIDHLSVIGQ